MTVFRSPLFVPGNKESMLEKALAFRPDALVPDMEDSVPEAEKANARERVAAFLPRLAASGIPVIPRVNSLHTVWVAGDLAAVVGPHIDGVSIGKIDSAEDIDRLCALVAELEAQAGLDRGRIKVLPWLESARAMVHCYDICIASPRIAAVAFGGEDFTHDMGIERREDESEVAFARSHLCIAARAAQVPALDTPYFRFRDEDGLRANCAAAKQCGFKGKFAIHPAQIEAINEAFSPSAREIQNAHRVVAAFEEAERMGRGSTSLEGKVIDVPVVKRARALLRFAALEQ